MPSDTPPGRRTSRDVERLRDSLPPCPGPVARPVMVVVSGLPGTGKTHFSQSLVDNVPLLVLESDALRKVLFPLPSHTGPESARLFKACYSLIDALLTEGVSLLLDATNLVEHHRERLYRIADRPGVKLVLISVQAPSAVVHQRLNDRSQGAGPQGHSTADWQVYLSMRSSAEPIARDDLVVDTSGDISQFVDEVAREIAGWMGGA